MWLGVGTEFKQVVTWAKVTRYKPDRIRVQQEMEDIDSVQS